jgi:hypothetical protein
MRYQNKEGQQLRGIFPRESQDLRNSSNRDSSSSKAEDSQYYAIGSEDEIIRRFVLIQGNAKRYSFSYSILPTAILEDSSKLYLKAYELLVTILGANLNPIHEQFTNERILWVRASPSGKNDGSVSTFVSDIIIEGDAVSTMI